ncbi:PREDICTED: phosphatidylinositol 4-phosphate 3-kinase C2 domain-containing subunit gamma [Hipposideros armiger]|uniref:Phosphatidylinositol 4-phosphate 3-kinase C2 domain-containing subunit gamma n=1 Tax=Hipposideros armiger TaxID=186990 RepID=A0A8B7PSJ3_HIPAR|nr:PREDICTED: phosphatidylinositol 4-phosphate 3-kinase C2 domain-containing subunit gamma [Hipposideros armiger]
MAYCWKTDLNPSESYEEQHEHQELSSANQPLCASQVSLGFDQLVDEISNKIPLYQSEIEENTIFVPSAPKWNSKKHSLDETQQISLNEFTSKSSELSCHQVRQTPVIGFRHSVLPNPQNMNKESSWGNPIGKCHGPNDYRFNTLAPSSTSLDKINSQIELQNENHNYPIGFESSIPSTYPSCSTDFMPREKNKTSGTMNIVEPSPMLFECSFLPKIWESTWPKKIELIGCSIQLVEVPQGSNMSLASFCDKVKRIRETYHAADINSNSGKIWSTTTTFPYQLFSDTKFSINIRIENSTQLLHFMPHANYLVKDLIAEILHFCTNDQLTPKDYLLSICGFEEFLQNDYCLGSHRIFQKDKSVIQLNLQKNKEGPGKLSRKHEDDHSQFYLNQLLEFMHIWKISRQCLSTVIKKYDSHLKYLLKIQQNVNNIIEEVKNICSVLGCVETKQITDAVNELNLILQGKAEMTQFLSFSTPPGLIEKVTTELSTSIYQLIDVYCSSFYADFQPLNASDSVPFVNPGLHSHLSFTVYAAHNIPATWVHRINFPLELKSLPRESMLTIKLFGIICATNNAELLAWTCLPLFPKDKSILGSMLFSMTLQSEPPIEMIAPGVWDISQPSPVTLQIDFPATEWEYMKLDSEENRTNLEEAPKECLKHIARLSQKQSPLLLSEEKRRYLWFYRFYCNNENCSLPLILGSAPGWDEKTISEMHTILRGWKFSHPLEALGLLTSSFPDQEIRKVAVQQLDNLLNDELLDYLPQLVQAVKFEWNLESPLVQLLLHRSLQSIQIAHRLYCGCFANAFDNDKKQRRKVTITLEVASNCNSLSIVSDFPSRTTMGSLSKLADSVWDVLKKELRRLEEFFQCINTCHLPLNPALYIKGIDYDACSYFTSNALPLKITFINANPMGKNISIIFKAGDDLRQDMLVLQIIQVMDNIWLQEGLDMQMIIYRCLSTGKGQGLVQMVPEAVTLAKIHRHSGLIGPLKENTIKKWFSQHNHLKADYEKALKNFFYSCAGWCVVTFILGVCDRHNDNIMLTKSGHMFHIDFGKFLGHAQTFGGIKRPQFSQDSSEPTLAAVPQRQILHLFSGTCFPEHPKPYVEDRSPFPELLPLHHSLPGVPGMFDSGSAITADLGDPHGITSRSDCILNFFLSEPVQQTIEEPSPLDLGEKFHDKTPKVQLVISYEDTKLTILVKHMKNIHLPDGSAPSAHVEFYLLPYPSEVRRRKTKPVPKCTDPTYNEIVVYDEVTELQGHVLMLIVKSKTTFVGAINIQLCSVPLNEEKWYPLGNSII